MTAGDPSSSDEFSAWNPGVGTALPAELRAQETIFDPNCVFSRHQELDELARLTGLPREELTVFRPERLALHELIIRVTADIAVAEGDEEEVFGHNFRRIAATLLRDHIEPHLPEIVCAYDALCQHAELNVQKALDESLFKPAEKPARRPFPFNLLSRAASNSPAETVMEQECRVLASYREAGASVEDPLQRAVFKGLYRVLGSIQGMRGRIFRDRDLLVNLVTQRVCNVYGSELIGQFIAPLIDRAIDGEGYHRVVKRPAPVLISLKGASAAGKSSLRPMIKQILSEQGIAPDGYATISPDVWRRLLLDYESLGSAYKYAGHLTGRELVVIDGKLDRYIRAKANRDQGVPHLLVDRFRFDSFSTEQVARVLHNTYARNVDTLIMYFIVTPPEETVERGWQRALARGRYKAVEDFLGHSVEAYLGMPKIFIKWLAYQRPGFRYYFLDNRVPKGSFPKTIAEGNQAEMTIFDPLALVAIERYQKINIYARSPGEVYPTGPSMALEANLGFLKQCLHRLPRVFFADPLSGKPYALVKLGVFEVTDDAVLAEVLSDHSLAEVFRQIAPTVWLEVFSERGVVVQSGHQVQDSLGPPPA